MASDLNQFSWVRRLRSVTSGSPPLVRSKPIRAFLSLVCCWGSVATETSRAGGSSENGLSPPEVVVGKAIAGKKETQAHRSKTIDELPSAPDRYAVIVGVGAYQDSNLLPLFGDNDAKSLAIALERYAGFPPQNVELLANGRPDEQTPTRSNILFSLSKVIQKVPEDGLLLLAFSGHGIQLGASTYILPSDMRYTTDPDLMREAGAISVDTITQMLRKAKLKQVLILVDTCRDLYVSKGGVGQPDNPLTQQYANSFDLHKMNVGVDAFATIYATQIGDRAYEYQDKKMSAFSWVLTKALQGNGYNDQNELTLQGLVDYLQEQVPRLLGTTNVTRIQKPWAVIEGYNANRLVLASTKGQQRSPLSSAPLLLTPDGREVYVADERTGKVLVLDAGAGKQTSSIDVGGVPREMVIAPRRGEIYVLDPSIETVSVIDINSRTLVGKIPAGTAPRSLAVTPDEKKLYIANEHVPQGTISVINLESKQLQKSITGVNCPEALTMTRDGLLLFVVTQCGSGEDPVFVVSTRTDQVERSVPGLAVGLAGMVTNRADKLYVGRGGPDRLSIVNTRTNQVDATLNIGARFFATTPDDRYLLALGGSRLFVLSTNENKIANEIPLDPAAGGIAVGRSEASLELVAYVWYPNERRLFLTGLSGILPH
jgi:YVTN family beta-propeller protein